MLRLFNKNSELLPENYKVSITWYYEKEILLQIRDIAKELVKLLPENPNVTYLGDVVNLKKLFNYIDKDINDIDMPSVIFEFNDIKLEFSGIVYFENPDRLIKTFTLQIRYFENVFNPSDYISRLERFEYISKICTNRKFDSKQNEHDLNFMNKKELSNKLLYPGYTKGAEIINKSLNPGYSVCIEKFGLIGIGCYNEFSLPLVEAFGKNVMINALNRFKIPYRWENNYLKFQLFDDHRKSEYPENLKLLINLKKEINFDQFLKDREQKFDN